MDAARSGMLICSHDDRPRAQVGLKLLVLSLAEHCPGIDVLVSWPSPADPFLDWLAARPGVRVHVDPRHAGMQWNIKPDLLLHCLDLGYEEVVWLDSDVIVSRDFRPLMSHAGLESLIVAEEFHWAVYTFAGSAARTELWGLQPGRPLPWTANTGVMRVTPAHVGLLEAWRTLLDSPPYVAAQQRDWTTRPVHMVGDQDVLTALLGSRRFADTATRLLRRGSDVLYNFGPSGYTPMERIRNLSAPEPPFVHCTGPKPWDAPRPVSPLRDLRAYYTRVGLELSDYSRIARRYRDHLDVDDIAFDMTTLPARLCRKLAGSAVPLQGLPLAAFHGLGRRLRKLAGFNHWPDPEANLRPGELPDGEALLAAHAASDDSVGIE
jgi:hypothetical protein